MAKDQVRSRRRLAAAVASLAVLIAVLGGWAVRQLYQQRDAARLAAAGLTCLQARFLVERGATVDDLELIDEVSRQGQFKIYAQPLIAPDRPQGSRVALKARHLAPAGLCLRERQALALGGARLEVLDGEQDGRHYAIARVAGAEDLGERTYLLEVALPYQGPAEAATRLALAVAVAAFVLLGAFGAWWTITYMDGRLADLAATLRRAAQGDYAARTPHAGDPTELGALSREINAALTRIQDQVVTLGVASARAGHELLDPIGRARARLSILAGFRLSASARAEVDGIDRRLDRAGQGARAILELTRAQATPPCAVALTALLVELVAAEHEVLEGRALTATLDEDIWIMGHPDRLRVLALNLLTNARKHAAAGPIEVELRRRTQDGRPAFHLEVRNSAPAGAALAGDLTGLFERHADTRAEGHGLGLNTVRNIAMSEGFRLGKTPSQDTFIIWITGPALASAPRA